MQTGCQVTGTFNILQPSRHGGTRQMHSTIHLSQPEHFKTAGRVLNITVLLNHADQAYVLTQADLVCIVCQRAFCIDTYCNLSMTVSFTYRFLPTQCQKK